MATDGRHSYAKTEREYEVSQEGAVDYTDGGSWVSLELQSAARIS